MAKKAVLFVFPTDWDHKQLARCSDGWKDEYDVILAEPSDVDCPWDFDIIGYIDRLAEEYRGKIAGVTSSSDYPGATVAGALATRLELPGSPPEVIINCSHKYYSRVAQRTAVPHATPAFQLIDPRDPDRALESLAFPCFIKPVKGAFSVMSQKLNSPDDLRAFIARPSVAEFTTDYVMIFNRLVKELTTLEIGGSFFLAEGFLNGLQVTVEGFAHGGAVEILGIVDSVMHPGSSSFARFDYPSALRPEIQHNMAHIARDIMTHLGFRDGLFNIEMIYEPSRDSIHIVEVNPRMCGQFADLYDKVDGFNSYRVALDLAVGQRPTLSRSAGSHAVATSFPLRTFEPVKVSRVPSEAGIADVESRFEDVLVWWECEVGQNLGEFDRGEDGSSYRYAVINIGAATRAELLTKLDRVRSELGYEFVSVQP